MNKPSAESESSSVPTSSLENLQQSLDALKPSFPKLYERNKREVQKFTQEIELIQDRFAVFYNKLQDVEKSLDAYLKKENISS